jgi:1,4-alpha-glucan branching enzyme
MVKSSSAKPIEFKLYAPQAKRVSLAGSFNNWDTKKIAAKKDPKGTWTANVNLPPGRHEYKFFVDGSWLNDPSCGACTTNAFGTQNCVREVR